MTFLDYEGVGLKFPEVRDFSSTPTASETCTSPANTEIGDLVLIFHWNHSTAGYTTTFTLQSGYAAAVGTGVFTDSGNDIGLQVGWKIATVAGAQSYRAYATDKGTDYTAIVVVKKDTFNASTPIASGAGGTFTTSTSPPNAAGVTSYEDDRTLAFIAAGWHITGSADVTVTFPPAARPLWSVSGSAGTEFAGCWTQLATEGDALTSATATFADNVTPNMTGTVWFMVRPPVNHGWQENVPIPIGKGHVDPPDKRTAAICRPPWQRCADREEYNEDARPRTYTCFESGSPLWDYPVSTWDAFDLTDTADGYIDVPNCNVGDKIHITVGFTYLWEINPGDWNAGIVAIDDHGGVAYQSSDDGIVTGAHWNATGSSPYWNGDEIDKRLAFKSTVVHEVKTPGTTRVTFGYKMPDTGSSDDRFKIYEFGMQAMHFPFAAR